MTSELVEALCKAYDFKCEKKPEQWYFDKMIRRGKLHAQLEEGKFTPWVRIQEHPDKVDIRGQEREIYYANQKRG